MHYCVRLNDEHGQFWMTERARMWTDEPKEALKFKEEKKAVAAAQRAGADMKKYSGWFPKIKVITFK